MLINKGIFMKPCNGLETNRAPSNRSRWKGWEVDKKAGAKQFQAQYKTSRSMLPSSAECQPHQASGVQFLGNNTCPYLAPNKIRWDLGIPVVQFSPDELSFAGGQSLTNQAKYGKIQTIMNEYVSIQSWKYLHCQTVPIWTNCVS